MDLTTAWAEMESWLRALAAPMAPAPVASARPVASTARPGDAPAPGPAGAATLPRRDARAAGLADPLSTVAARGPAASLGKTVSSAEGPAAPAGELPADTRPGAGPTAAPPAAPVAVRYRPGLRATDVVGTATTGWLTREATRRRPIEVTAFLLPGVGPGDLIEIQEAPMPLPLLQVRRVEHRVDAAGGRTRIVARAGADAGLLGQLGGLLANAAGALAGAVGGLL